MTLQTWIKDLDSYHEDTLAIRRHLHQHPEPSFEEKETAAFLLAKLKSYGIDDIREQVGNGYGMVATIHGSKPGLTIGLRADFDALRIKEESDVPFASENEGIMHACGHDAHASALLSVARVLQLHKDELHGNVVLIFQNAEEQLPGGAASMCADGALDGVDKMFGIHVQALSPVGQISYRYGFGCAAADSFAIDIHGRGGHAASPHLTHDAVVIATSIITQAQMIVSRAVNPIYPAVLTFGGVSAGGSAFNIIADRARLRGTVRTLQPEVRTLVHDQLVKLVESICALNDAEADIEYTFGYPSIQNTKEEVDTMVEVTQAYFGKENVVETPIGMGGEDFAYYLEKVPGCFFYVGAMNDAIDANYPHHHPKFKIDEASIRQSGEAFLALIAHYLLEA